jgi:hypothetical protein
MRKNLSLAIYFIATYLLLSTSVKTLSVEITQAIFAFLAASFASSGIKAVPLPREQRQKRRANVKHKLDLKKQGHAKMNSSDAPTPE